MTIKHNKQQSQQKTHKALKRAVDQSMAKSLSFSSFFSKSLICCEVLYSERIFSFVLNLVFIILDLFSQRRCPTYFSVAVTTDSAKATWGRKGSVLAHGSRQRSHECGSLRELVTLCLQSEIRKRRVCAWVTCSFYTAQGPRWENGATRGGRVSSPQLT